METPAPVGVERSPQERFWAILGLVAAGGLMAGGFALSASDSRPPESSPASRPAPAAISAPESSRSASEFPLTVCGAEARDAVNARANLGEQPGYPGIQRAYRVVTHLLQRDCPDEARQLGFWADGLPRCDALDQATPPCIGGVALGIKALPDVIGTCPSAPVTPSSDAESTEAAAGAAVRYLTTMGQWVSAKVERVYRVGTSSAGFGSLFAAQVTEWCGPDVADASYGVELTDTTGAGHGTDTYVGVVVSHFPTGWQVWSAFH